MTQAHGPHAGHKWPWARHRAQGLATGHKGFAQGNRIIKDHSSGLGKKPVKIQFSLWRI
jgi:hypothetical protein